MFTLPCPRLSTLFLICTPLLAACGGNDDDAGDAAGTGGARGDETIVNEVGGMGGRLLETEDLSRLTGRYYLVEQNGPYLPDNRQVMLWFGGDELAWDPGCNSPSGPYSVEHGVLWMDSFSSDAAQCGTVTTVWASFMWDVLSSRPRVYMAGKNVVLATAAAKLVFAPGEGTRPKQPDALLEGTAWEVIGLDELTRSWHYNWPDPYFMGSLVFGEQGQLTITAPCNTGSGSYEVLNSGELALHSITWTKQGCADDYSAERDRVLVNLFEGGSVTYTIDEHLLTLIRPNNPEGSRSLTARVTPK